MRVAGYRHLFGRLPITDGPDRQLMLARRQVQLKYALAIGRRTGASRTFGVDAGKGYGIALFIGYLPGKLVGLRVGQYDPDANKNKRKPRFQHKHSQNYQKVAGCLLLIFVNIAGSTIDLKT